VGGQPAVPNSWPAQVLIIMNAIGTDKENRIVKQEWQFAGTIIDRFTILSTASLIVTSFYHNGYTVNVTDPFDATQYTVYVGLQYEMTLTYPVVAMSVQNIIRVC
jgi:hypothetical protein